MTDDVGFEDLARIWEAHDPMPSDLVEKSLIAIETDDLDAEYELLHLVERSREMQGTRSAMTALTISFAVGEVALMLRVSPTRNGFCRIDGWVTPPRPTQVKATQHPGAYVAEVDERGRFEFVEIPTGLTRFWLSRADGGSGPDREPAGMFSTPIVEL